MGFGGKIILTAKDVNESTIAPGDDGLLSIDKIGGMRHQSAARYIHANPRDIAFVVSQDGGVTVFWWPEYEKCPTMHKHVNIPLHWTLDKSNLLTGKIPVSREV